METGNRLSLYRRIRLAGLALTSAALVVGLLSTNAHIAKGDSGSGDMGALSSASVPVPTGGNIIDQTAAIRLGKALFWDTQVGGDGQTACASCHFHAGADNRTLNVINPGPDGIFASDDVNGPGQQFHPTNITNDDRVGSQGVVGTIFSSISSDPSNPVDNCAPDIIAPFFHNRRVTGRQAPPVIGAVFNRQNFWDGRANDKFNGVDPFGATANAGAPMGTLMSNSSLASQADGPPNNPTEMSCANRPFNGANSLGAKMLARPALQYQYVHPNDSALGAMSAWPSTGLKCGNHSCTYAELVTAAFGASWADASKFSRVWGQAVQAYEAILIPDQTPLDKFLSGNSRALTDNQKKGLSIFGGKGQCSKCHAGAEMTDASVSFAIKNGLINDDGGDQGFHNIGVRPTGDDAGRAGLGPNGFSFSESGSAVDHGAFKTPALRNVKLTAPYFHNGGKATLADVVDFYSRGGDFDNTEKAKRIKNLSLSAAEKASLVDFLTNALTDCRVEREEGPFDHPSIALPNGPSVAATGGGNSCR
jgi:cytochrome c peroxidase